MQRQNSADATGELATAWSRRSQDTRLRAPTSVVVFVGGISRMYPCGARGSPRLGPHLDRCEVVGLHRPGLALGHRRLLRAIDREHDANLVADRLRVFSTERIGRHVEVTELFRRSFLPRLRMAAGAVRR